MLARSYDKRIDVYEVTSVPNEFSGHTTIETLRIETWAKLTTNGLGNKATDMGLTSFENPLLFQVRWRSDVEYEGRTMLVKYRGDSYIIQAVRVINERNREVEIFCARQEPEIYE